MGMKKNILLITIDSLRFDHKTSTLEDNSIINEMAADGCSFDFAFATGPGTTPSFPALLTGTLPLSCSGLGPLTTERPRVTTNLSKGGLNTGGFQCNPFLSEHFGYDEGFDIFEDYQNPLMGIATRVFPRGIELSNPRMRRIDQIFNITELIKKTYTTIKGKPRPYVSAEVVTDDALSWLDGNKGPFFGWVHYMDVHHPCFPPAQYRNAFDVDEVGQSTVADWYGAMLTDTESLNEEKIETMQRLYDAAAAYVNDQIGRLVEKLREQNRFEDTMIIITSDHGELFGDHGDYGKPERMYDELLRVPLIITNGPDYLSSVDDDLVSLLDLPPLFHDVLDLPVPEAYEGNRLGIDNPRDYVLAEHEVEGDVVVGARSQDWLYEADEIKNEHRLFDLRSGFKRVEITTTQDQPGAAMVRKAVLDRLGVLEVDTPALDEQVDGDIQGRLEDLGYL